MFYKTAIVAALCTVSYTNATAEEIMIEGQVQSKCVITTDTAGVYGNPTADKLTTTPADGGVIPIIRYDVSLADAYKAKVTTPSSFTSSPSLNDVVTWTGSTSVDRMSDAAMSGYEAAKVTYNDTTEYDLTESGSLWLKSESTATNGGGKAFPSGTYRAAVTAECIAK
jgi:hypothetical protein